MKTNVVDRPDPADYLDLPPKIARYFQGRGLDFDDLVSEGQLGLLRACETYDPARHGDDFPRYARRKIRDQIRDALRDSGRPIRVPRGQQTLANKVRRGEVSLDDLSPVRRTTLESAMKVLDRPPIGEGQFDDMTLADILVDQRDDEEVDLEYEDVCLARQEALEAVRSDTPPTCAGTHQDSRTTEETNMSRLNHHANGVHRSSSPVVDAGRPQPANRKGRGQSGYRGVSKGKGGPNPWVAALTDQGKTHRIGAFSTAESAARAYDAEVRRRGLPADRLNFPDEPVGAAGPPPLPATVAGAPAVESHAPAGANPVLRELDVIRRVVEALGELDEVGATRVLAYVSRHYRFLG